jgi:hypothetical protein
MDKSNNQLITMRIIMTPNRFDFGDADVKSNGRLAVRRALLEYGMRIKTTVRSRLFLHYAFLWSANGEKPFHKPVRITLKELGLHKKTIYTELNAMEDAGIIIRMGHGDGRLISFHRDFLRKIESDVMK